MNCLEFRKQIGAEPGSLSAELKEHRSECQACAAFAIEMSVLEEMIVEALQIDVPAPGAKTQVSRVRTLPRWAGLAASFLLVVGLSTAVWVALPQSSLAEAVIEHMHHEPNAMVRTPVEVDTGKLADVLSDYGASINPRAETVTYVRHCYFRMKFVPHLVIQGDDGPVMVLLIPDEFVDGPTSITEEGFSGMIYPHANGSIAVVGTDGEDIDLAAKRILEAVDWQG